jgi:hypothetical protein
MSAGPGRAAPGGLDLTAHRIRSLVSVAAEHRTGVPVEQLPDLLPTDAPTSPLEVSQWIGANVADVVVRQGRAIHLSVPQPIPALDDRRRRGAQYRVEAERIARAHMAAVRSMVRTLCVTGSAAYGEPEADDDVDLLVVARRDSLWLVLTWTYLALRRHPPVGADGERLTVCLNFALEESAAEAEFRSPQGFLFAREALMAQPIVGEPYFRSLIGTAGWMRAEVPRLYARSQADGFPAVERHPAPGLPVRLLNALLFPVIATYLQLQGILRNRAYRRAGQPDRQFRTLTRYRRLAFASWRFDRLKARYDPARVVRGRPE